MAKKLTDEMARTHHARLQIALIAHTAALRRVIAALENDKMEVAVRELGKTVDRLEAAMYENAKELGYKRPKSGARKRSKR